MILRDLHPLGDPGLCHQIPSDLVAIVEVESEEGVPGRGQNVPADHSQIHVPQIVVVHIEL